MLNCHVHLLRLARRSSPPLSHKRPLSFFNPGSNVHFLQIESSSASRRCSSEAISLSSHSNRDAFVQDGRPLLPDGSGSLSSSISGGFHSRSNSSSCGGSGSSSSTSASLQGRLSPTLNSTPQGIIKRFSPGVVHNTSSQVVVPRFNYQNAGRPKLDGTKVCSDWWISCFRNTDKCIEDLTGLLEKMELWVTAYQKVCQEVLGSYPANCSHDKTLMYNLQNLSRAVLDCEYTWGGYGKIYIISPKEKDIIDEMGSTRREKYLARIHASPIFQDRILQEVLLMILEPIFEARFSPKSHGYRPGRDAHTALRTIRRSFPGYLWYFKGDVSSSLNTVRPGLLMRALFNVVKDKRVLSLIKAGVMTEPPPPLPKPVKPRNKREWKKQIMEEGAKPDPYWLESFFGFVPKELEKPPSWGCCGVLSSLLLNVYFDQLDKWTEERMREFLKVSTSDSIWNNEEEVRAEGDSSIQFVPAAHGAIKTRRMDFIRFGTQFLVAMRGPKFDAAEMRKYIIEFCETELKLKLNADVFKLIHVKKGIAFLDHIISRRLVQTMVRRTSPDGKVIREKVEGSALSMTMSLEACMAHFRKTGFLKGQVDAQPCFRLFHAPQSISNAQINNILLHLAEWFKYADNRKKATMFCQYILRSSLCKMYAAKYKLRSRAQVYKVSTGDLSRPIKDKKGLSEHYKRMMKKGFVEGEIPPILFMRSSMSPPVELTPLPKNWMPKHEVILKELATMVKRGCKEKLSKQLEETPTLSPQENMSHILWSFYKGSYHAKSELLSIINAQDEADESLQNERTHMHNHETRLSAEKEGVAKVAGM